MREVAPANGYLDKAIPGHDLKNPFEGDHFHYKEKKRVARHTWYPKQRTDTDELLLCFKRQGGAILASNVGCMKTAQCCALIQSLTGAGFKRFFIIAPATLERQWRQHITLWLNELEGMKGNRLPMYDMVFSLKEYDEFFKIKANA